jgi:hypothetical protein
MNKLKKSTRKSFLKKSPGTLLIQPLAYTRCILLLLIFPHAAIANDAISVAVPYLPPSIDLYNETEPVGMLLMKNISTPLVIPPGTKHPLSAKKISRSTPSDSEDISQIWQIEYMKGTPLDRETSMNASVLRDSFESLQTLNTFFHSPDSSRQKALGKIHTIYFSENDDRFTAHFALLSPVQDFPQILSGIPLVNKQLADLFGKFTGKGTNVPFFGPFSVVEYLPDQEIKLQRNDYYGFPGDQSKARTLYFKVYDNVETVMRSLRSGSISMIAFPCQVLINDAMRDRTLAVIPSPFAEHDTSRLTFLNPHCNTEAGDVTEKDLLLQPEKLIVRRSLQLSSEFSKSFDFKDVTKGEI